MGNGLDRHQEMNNHYIQLIENKEININNVYILKYE